MKTQRSKICVALERTFTNQRRLVIEFRRIVRGSTARIENMNKSYKNCIVFTTDI